MKKSALFAAVALISLLLAGCGADPDYPAASEDDRTTIDTAASSIETTMGPETTTALPSTSETTSKYTSKPRTTGTSAAPQTTTSATALPTSAVTTLADDRGKVIGTRFKAPDGRYTIHLPEADDWTVMESGSDCVQLQSMKFIDTAVLRISRSPAAASFPTDDRSILHYVSAVMTGGGYGSPIKRQELSGMQTVTFGYSGIYKSHSSGPPAKDPYLGQVTENKSYAYTNAELWGSDGVYDYKLLFHVRSYKFEDSDEFRSYMIQYVDLLTESLLTFTLLDPL